MKKIRASFFAVLLMLFSAPVFAQTVTDDVVVIDDSACRSIVRHVPAADAAYQPGVDVKGRPVVEADINAAAIKIPHTVSFPITVDVMKYAGITPPAGVEGLASIGQVDVHPDGRMYFNGAPIEGEAEAALRALCKDRPAGKKPVKKGQKPFKHGLLNPAADDYNR